MSDVSTAHAIPVSDVMSRKIIRIPYNRPITSVAKLMVQHHVGSVIVTNEEGEPHGIITRGDIIKRVVAEYKDPGLTQAKEACSSPIITCKSTDDLEEAILLMSQHQIERLLVIDPIKKEPVGIVTMNDILYVAPSLLRIRFQDRSKLEIIDSDGDQTFQGYCDDCGNYSSNLKEFQGYLLCEDCRAGYADSVRGLYIDRRILEEIRHFEKEEEEEE